MRVIFIVLLTALTMLTVSTAAQALISGREIRVTVNGADSLPLAAATVRLLDADASPIKTLFTDSLGLLRLTGLSARKYFVEVSRVGFRDQRREVLNSSGPDPLSLPFFLVQEATVLDNVSVSANRPMVRFHPDKTVINVDAGITNAGATVLEVLEKSPGITLDKEGNISLKGRAGVQVMIDGKLTQLSGADLQSLLSGMNASQVETIELMDNPPARYDAAGNAGLINIRTKKMQQKGFNGNLTLAYGQGHFPKNNDNLQLNYRSGKLNAFFGYSLGINRYLMDLYALRTYFGDNGMVTGILEQPYATRGTVFTHNLRTGMDYFISSRTTLGFTFTGTYLKRDSKGNSKASWKDNSGTEDSAIFTSNRNNSRLKQGGMNLNLRHSFTPAEELTADVDVIGYDIYSRQLFENRSSVAGTREEGSKGEIPSDLQIFSAKTDYSKRFAHLLWDAGWKTSLVNTDNLARYYYKDGSDWLDDAGKSNHFLYKENIQALYSSFRGESGRWQWQAGLRYEYTGYKARQLGNAQVKDSSFNRNYHSLFPSALISYKLDSLHTLMVRAGRRIDRPGFQKLNPFVFIINKYTFQRGNPYFLPQYTWNMELSHQYKDLLSTSLSYSITDSYFSQIFLSDSVSGTIVYTEGNVGKMQNLGISAGLQWPITSWWSVSLQGVLNHKIIEGVLWKNYRASITQANFSVNQQFRFGKGWAAELSGFYISRNQNDLQEVLDPTGQVSAGCSRQLMKNKATLKLVIRDIFYTQAMQGLTDFQNTSEYFKLQRDTRVATLSFSWRFGKTMKASSRSSGSAEDLIQRAGSVN